MTSRFFVLFVFFVAILCPIVGQAAEPSAQPASARTTELPPDLAIVPPDTALLLCFDLSNYWTGPEAESLKRISNTHPVVPTWWLRDMPAATGLAPENVVRMMQFSGTFPSVSVVTTREAYDRAKVLAALAPDAAQKSAGGKTYFQSAKTRNSVFPLNDRTLLIGMGNDLQGFLSRSAAAQRDESLDRALAAAKNGAPIVIHAGPDMVRKIAADQKMQNGRFASLATAHAWQIIAEADKDLTISLLTDFATKEEADKSTAALKSIGQSLTSMIPFYKSNMTPFLTQQSANYPAVKDLIPKMTAALDSAAEGLKTIQVASKNNRSGAEVKIKTGEPLTTAIMLLTLTPRAAK
jgi:hypothetical protein